LELETASVVDAVTRHHQARDLGFAPEARARLRRAGNLILSDRRTSRFGY
jgi:hypothetical protein